MPAELEPRDDMATAPETDSTTSPDERAKPPFLRRVRIRGYKSIAFCDVTLEPLTILVGRNASGKSNFVDALAFLRDVIATNLTEATTRHGGWQSILSRISPDGMISFELEFDFSTSTQVARGNSKERLVAEYGLAVKEGPPDTPVVIREWSRGFSVDAGSDADFSRTGTYDPTLRTMHYEWAWNLPEVSCAEVPNPRPDRLWIDSLGKQEFINIADGLRFSGYYNFSLDAIRRPAHPAPSGFLNRDGSNLASVIELTRNAEGWVVERVGRYLNAITDVIEFGGVRKTGGFEVLKFRVSRDVQGPPLDFDASSMSDGTLRAFAALVAAFQFIPPHGSPSLVAIEEPETSLHPAAMRALVDALDEATLRTQILLTTHSAELLDNPTIRPENVRVVEMVNGATVITPVDEATVGIVRDRLGTLGGLERDRQLQLNLDDVDRQDALAKRGQSAP